MTPPARVARIAAIGLTVALAAAFAAFVHAEEPPEPKWLVGDLHVHVSPPDEKDHSALSVETAMEASRKAGLDFVAFTPHERTTASAAGPGGRAVTAGEFIERAAGDVARRTPAEGRPWPLVAAGWEYTRDDPGHLGVLFSASVAERVDEAALRDARTQGALVVVNHPFFRPVTSDLPVMKLVTGDRRWRPFFGEGKDDLAWNAIEVWHERSVLVQKMHANLAAKFPGTQMVSDALKAWDRATREQERRIVAVGGSDCHGKLPYAVTPVASLSVLVAKADLAGLREGLLAARVTFGRDGGAAARDFAATSDVPGERASIGGSLRAKSEVRLTWGGRAALLENGERVGEFEGGAVRRLPGPFAFASWRIEKEGDAYSNCVYANLP